MENKKRPGITEAQLREFYIPDGPSTPETSAEFREKNNLKTFEDIEAVKTARDFYQQQGLDFYRTGLNHYLNEVKRQKEWELAKKCYQLITEAAPTVKQAFLILDAIKSLIECERITPKP